MWGDWLHIALCVAVMSATSAAAGSARTTPDVSAKWLEDFRRDLLRETYDYGPAPDTPGPRRSASGPRGTLDGHGDLTGSDGNSSADDVASRELGISRRDLYGPQDGALLTDVELEGPRRLFLENLHELEEQLKPVYLKPGAHTRQSDGRAALKQSRKRNEDNSNEDVEEKTPHIMQGGIKRYRVHTDPKQRLRNPFGGAEPFLSEESVTEAQEAPRSDVRERQNTRNLSVESQYEDQRGDERLPHNQGYEYQARQNGIGDETEDEDNESDDGERHEAQRDVRDEPRHRHRDDGGESSSDRDGEESAGRTAERDVSEYAHESVTSRYLRRGGGGRAPLAGTRRLRH